MIRKELSFFLIIGMTTVAIDFITYNCFLWTQVFSINFSKSVGFLFGTVFSYFSNKNFTFGHQSYKSGSLMRFILVYGISLIVNISINSYFIYIISNNFYNFQVAFLIATLFSATTNFLGMKFFVFK